MKYLLISMLVMGNIRGLDCSASRKGCSPCYGGRKSPELNREYYLPPSQITWRQVSEEELKENDRKASVSHMTQSFQYSGRGIERLEGEPRTQICDGGRPYHRVGEESPREFPSQKRRRSSSATTTMSESSDSSDGSQNLDRPTTLCDRLRLSLAGICTSSRWVWTPAQTGYNPLTRQNSFVDDQEPGLQHRTQVVDTRRRIVSLPFSTTPKPSAPPASLYPYTSAAGARQMISIPGNNKPYAAKKSKNQK